MALFAGGQTFEDDRTVVLWGGAAVVLVLVAGILGAAVARDNGGVHEFFNGQSSGPMELRPTEAPERYSSVPPLTVQGERQRQRRGVAARQVAPRARSPRLAAPRLVAPSRVARHDAGPRKATRTLAQVPLPPVWTDPPAGRPPIVSLYEDRTLRRGDAVMTAKGIRIFAGSSTFPFRPEDFRNIASTRSLDIPFRKALIDIDRTPVWPG